MITSLLLLLQGWAMSQAMQQAAHIADMGGCWLRDFRCLTSSRVG